MNSGKIICTVVQLQFPVNGPSAQMLSFADNFCVHYMNCRVVDDKMILMMLHNMFNGGSKFHDVGLMTWHSNEIPFCKL